MRVVDLTVEARKALAITLARLTQHDGLTLAQAGAKTGLKRQQVSHLLRKYGFGGVRPHRADAKSTPVFLRDREDGVTFEEVVAWRREGHSWEAIAERLGRVTDGRRLSATMRYHARKRGLSLSLEAT